MTSEKTRSSVTPQGEKPIVLITGSEGLIGDAVVRACSDRYEIAGFDIKRPDKNPEREDFIDCDFTKDDLIMFAIVPSEASIPPRTWREF